MENLILSNIDIKELPNSGNILFYLEDEWIMRISKDGSISFNRDDFPELEADDFAKEVVKILETIKTHSPVVE